MQTVLGASGQIGSELAKALKQNFTDDIRLVSRNPKKVNSSDKLFSANLLDFEQTSKAVEDSEIVYFTAGLPIDSKLWVQQFPIMMSNVIKACALHKAKLVFFDNTYMYPQTDAPQIEEAPFEPYGTKGKVRAGMTLELLEAIMSKNFNIHTRCQQSHGTVG